MKTRYRLSILAGLLAAAALTAQTAPERQLMEATNADRAAHGLGSVRWDPALARAAQAHAQLMSEERELSHQYPGEPDLISRTARQGAHFRTIAENVALGPDPQTIERNWMHSTPHRANILDARLNAIGVGMVMRGGSYYAVEDFAAGIAALGPGQIERQVGQLLAERGIQSAGFTQDARKTCAMAHGTAGGSAPKLVVRWEGSDLSRLPGVLEQQIATGRYRAAAVGACASGQAAQGFTAYRVAVMLY